MTFRESLLALSLSVAPFFSFLLNPEVRQRLCFGPVSHAGHSSCYLTGPFMPATFIPQTLHRKDRLGGEDGEKGQNWRNTLREGKTFPSDTFGTSSRGLLS